MNAKGIVLKKVVLFGVAWCSGEFGGCCSFRIVPWVPQDGHHAYPVGPVSGYHDVRQIGFPWVPQDGHHAYPVGPSSGYPIRQAGFHGAPQEGHLAYPVDPSSGYATRPVVEILWDSAGRASCSSRGSQ